MQSLTLICEQMFQLGSAIGRHILRGVLIVEILEDIQALVNQLDCADRDAQELISGLTQEQAAWQPAPGSWSIVECLDHLGLTNHIYIEAMQQAATRARTQGKMRRGPTRPGLGGALFARLVEPPIRPRFRLKAPESIQPRTVPAIAVALAGFLASQQEVRNFLLSNADLDLARIRFAHPFIPGPRFSLASGLSIILAHDRRHLWQARRVRNAMSSVSVR
jgi:hypothetical protein